MFTWEIKNAPAGNLSITFLSYNEPLFVLLDSSNFVWEATYMKLNKTLLHQYALVNVLIFVLAANLLESHKSIFTVLIWDSICIAHEKRFCP